MNAMIGTRDLDPRGLDARPMEARGARSMDGREMGAGDQDDGGRLAGGPRRAEANGSAPQAAAIHTLRRTGRKAIRFEGWQLIEALGSNGGRHVWHDLNIYRTVKGSIVVELIARRGLADHHDVSHVQTFDDLAAAANWLEAYRPAEDVPIPAGLGGMDTTLPWAVLQAVQLRQRIDRIELDYRALLSEVFAVLDLTDPADIPPIPAATPGIAPSGITPSGITPSGITPAPLGTG
jgi:hypothetical protein